MTLIETETLKSTAMVHLFDDAPESRFLLGNKGANLVIMTRLGLSVPPGFIITVKAFQEYRGGGRLPEHEIREAISRLSKRAGKGFDNGLSVSVRSSAAASMPGMMDTFLNIDSLDKVLVAICRVFESWDNPRAIEYRRLNDVPYQMGTAAIVQSMVMGNRDDNSGTGVIFTRNPNTGEKELFGEYMHRSQGEALVSGAKTPKPVEELRTRMPQIYAELERIADRLEKHFKDMQDIEFTIESGRLYILQTRSGKRGSQGAVRIARDMVHERLISRQEALLRVTPREIGTLLHKHVDGAERFQPISRGLPAAPGAATGSIVFDPLEASDWKMHNSGNVILVRPETTPDDIQGIAAADGLLTSEGGLTSHAAIVARAMGKPCVCAAENIHIDLETEEFKVGTEVVHKGDIITVDGNTGNIYLGALPLVEPDSTPEAAELADWADVAKHLAIRANADTVEMIVKAKRMGAESIGLCRTERQFNTADRLALIRRFILATTPEEVRDSLRSLYELQKQDFIAIFEELQGMPIIIRLLDMPLHEFLPAENETTDPLVSKRIQELSETNPMLGHRGVRLGITHPEIYQMQINSIAAAKKEVGANVSIMIPQIINLEELLRVKQYIPEPTIRVGVMLETVRACLRAGRLAEAADFFSFGTNDLTQAVYSFSREDAERKFLPKYLEMGILKANPFEVLDVKGVGQLMETAIHWGRQTKPDIEIGVCGEHAGEPDSIKFFHQLGVDYVSCSPFRIPVARLASAQAAINERAIGVHS